MKQIFYTAAIALMCLACTDQKVDVSEPIQIGHLQFSPKEIRKSLSDVFISSASLCEKSVDPNCRQQVYVLQVQLMKFDPIPVPQLNVAPPIAAAEAISLYKQFVTDHAGEPILTVFRQLYPRILLNKYGVINGSDYQQIAYFTRELIESESYDFGTQATALRTIQTHVPPAEFKQLVQMAVTNSHLARPVQEESFKRQMESLSKFGFDNRLFQENVREHFRATMVKNNQAANLAMNQIEQLHVSTLN